MRRIARICWALTLLYWLGLFIATHIPAPRLPYIPVADKTAHFVTYALLAIALCLSFSLSGRTDHAALVLASLLAYAAIDELLQIPVNRSCEMADWYADVAGAAAGVVIARVLLWRRFG